jgi:hypothetical protein
MSSIGTFSEVDVGGNGNDGLVWVLDAAGTGVVALTQWGLDVVDSNSGALTQLGVPTSPGGGGVRPIFILGKDGTPILEFIQDSSWGGVSLSIGGPNNPGYLDIMDASGISTFILDATALGHSYAWIHGDINVGGDVLLQGADCAEQFDVNGPEPDPGTVLVIDERGSLRESRDAYDKKVAGVVSGAGDYRHAILLDNHPQSEGRVPVSLVGKVYCKVDAKYSPIRVGDLLTTSPTPGHAMKATDPVRAFGSVIGKALKSLRSGRRLIPILISLQ